MTALLVAALFGFSAESASGASASDGSSSARSGPLRMVEMGDSWIAGDHCDCVTFAGLWAADLQQQTGRAVQLTDLTGVHERSPVESKTSGSMLWALRHDRQTRHILATSDIVLVS
ncbi:MAG TPA: hypothetical protein VH419_05575, partial [Nocardioidaceae bacterium]